MKLAGSFGGYEFGPGGEVAVTGNGFDGLEGPAPRRNTNQDRNSGGQLRGKDVRDARQFTASFLLRAFTPADFETLRVAFLAAFRESDIELPLLFDDSTRMVWASVDSLTLTVTTDARQRSATADVTFTATDPNIYGPAEVVAVNATPAMVEHGGNAETPGWVVEVDGACNTPTFTAQLASGEDFVVGMSGSLASGETLRLDGRFDEGLVVDSTTGAYIRTADLFTTGGRPAVLWPIAPVESEVTFTSVSGEDEATLTIRPVL